MTDENSNKLDDLLDGDGPEMELDTAPEPAQQPEPEQEAIETTGENDAAPPAADDDDAGPLVPRKALEDERRKRQEYERQYNEVSAWIQQQQQAAQQPPQPQEQIHAPDPWTDPEGALLHQQERLQGEFQRQIVATRVETSRQLMRMQHADYADKEAVFDQLCAQQPELLQQAASHPMPAQFAYEVARRALIWQQYEANPAAFEALASGQPAPAPSQPQAQPSAPSARVPVSLAQRTSAAPRNTQGRFIEHASIDDILDG